MPTTVTQKVRVVDVRAGDRIAELDAPVITAHHKQVWSTFEVAGHKDLRLRGDTMIEVMRDVMTDEEKEANKRMFMVDGLRTHLTKLLSGTPLTEVEAAVEKYNPAYGELLTSYNLPGILKTQAMYRQGLVLRRLVHNVAERRGVDAQLLRINHPDDVKLLDEDILLDAYAVWYYEATDRNHRVGPVDPTSRSTSPLSNLIEDVERWAVEKILDELRWYVMKDVFNARIEEIKREVKRNVNG